MDLSLQSRVSGIVLHPTSLPGRFGIGDLGSEARRFVDFLAAGSQRLWQILPTGPTQDDWFSPYLALSAFAGNPLLISPERLQEEGLLSEEDLRDTPPLSEDRVDFRRVVEVKRPLLVAACRNFQGGGGEPLRQEFERFCRREAAWLKDFALFMAIRESLGGKPWNEWPAELRHRDPTAIGAARREFAGAVLLHQFIQFVFFRQWADLKRYANQRGIGIVGDMPIYVSYDSADVWLHPEYFQLSETLEPRYQAGVPPDDFFQAGQNWSNPVYDWNRLREDGYSWWVDRFRSTFELSDFVRIDHFRGFEAYWAIPFRESASAGHWVPGPGSDFFATVRARLGTLPIMVEDLGIITPPVHALREEFGFPGMFVLQFAFKDGSPYLPYKCRPEVVMYTGVHDSATTVEWLEACPPWERQAALDYLGARGADGIHWDFLRLAWGSVARWAIAPLQDVLGLGAEGRMNWPGTTDFKNWSWRYRREALTPGLAERLSRITRIYGRG